jgi:hypothetical protein
MRRVIIALVLLVIIAGAIWLVIYLNKEEPFKQDRTLYSYEDRSVEEISIVSGTSELSFVKKPEGWAMVKPKPYKIDAGTVGSLENRLKDFLAARVLEEESYDLKTYGLDEPKATITFKLDDGTQNTLFIGEMTASKVQYYAKDSAREQIYILGSYDVENFLRPVNEFRDRTILKVDPASLSSIGLDISGKRDFKLVTDGSGTWELTEPLRIAARGDAVAEMTNDIQELKIKDFIEADGSLEKYGLENPAFTLELADSRNAQKIYFGNVDEENQIIYIKNDDSDEICTLSLEAFDPRRFKIAEFLNEAPLSVSIGDVNKVVIIENSSTVEFLRDATKAEDSFTLDGKAVNMEQFTTLYVDIMALTAEGYDPSNTGGVPELTVMLELKDSSETIKAEFVKRDELSYYMVLNGEPRPFFIGERKIDLIRRWRDRILEGI